MTRFTDRTSTRLKEVYDNLDTRTRKRMLLVGILFMLCLIAWRVSVLENRYTQDNLPVKPPIMEPSPTSSPAERLVPTPTPTMPIHKKSSQFVI